MAPLEKQHSHHEVQIGAGIDTSHQLMESMSEDDRITMSFLHVSGFVSGTAQSCTGPAHAALQLQLMSDSRRVGSCPAGLQTGWAQAPAAQPKDHVQGQKAAPEQGPGGRDGAAGVPLHVPKAHAVSLLILSLSP